MEPTQYSDFWQFLYLLKANNLLKHVIVIGSWAEYLYAQSGMLPGFSANIRTLDVDFLIKNMRKPTPAKSITELVRKEKRYTIDSDLLNGTTKIYTPNLMEIEFLISQQSSGRHNTLQTNLGVVAQALRHMNILKDNTIEIRLFDMDIIAPCPEAYALHKIVINKERHEKAEKDKAAILNLLPFLSADITRSIYDTLAKKEKKIISAFFEENNGLSI